LQFGGRPPTQAPRLHSIASRTGVTVVAGDRYVGVNTASRGIAGVSCAGIGVITVRGWACCAYSDAAYIVGGARIAVVASGCVGGVYASADGITHVVSTGVAVIAGYWGASGASAGNAGVVDRARIAIVAPENIGNMGAAEKRIADIVGTGVAVVAVRRKPTETSPGATSIPNRASIAIVADRGYVHVLAAQSYIADGISAGVVVVTIGEDPAYAGASTVTGVVGGTGVAVLAGRDVRRVEAAASRIAGVVCAHVEIVAVGGEAA